MAASIEEVEKQVNAVAKKFGFSCEYVSWNDVQRATDADGKLSCFGSNINDASVFAKDGRRLFTVRSENFDERLGLVRARDVVLVVGNENPPDDNSKEAPPLSNVTLEQYLSDVGRYAGYAGVGEDANLSANAADEVVSVRFQTVFIPLQSSNKAAVPPPSADNRAAAAAAAAAAGSEEQQDNRAIAAAAASAAQAVATPASIADAALEFAPASYSYGTTDPLYPANAILLACSSGTSFQQDARGLQLLYLHQRDRALNTYRYWLEAERTRFSVQDATTGVEETNDEKAANERRGKSTTMPIGIAAMGARLNTLMTVQVPLLCDYNEEIEARRAEIFALYGGTPPKRKRVLRMHSKTGKHGGAKSIEYAVSCNDDDYAVDSASQQQQQQQQNPALGDTRAARISRGSRAGDGPWGGVLRRTHVERDPEQRVTVTVVNFFVVTGGVPTAEDVVMAIEDLNRLYAACSGGEGKRADMDVVNKKGE